MSKINKTTYKYANKYIINIYKLLKNESFILSVNYHTNNTMYTMYTV